MPQESDALLDESTSARPLPNREADPAGFLARPSLLELPREEAAERMYEDWERSGKSLNNLKEQWRINYLRRKGYTGLRLIKEQDAQKAYIPMGAAPNVAAMNQAARLCRRLRAQMFADEPVPDVVPSSGEDADADTADFATRVLIEECSEGKLSYNILAADAFDAGSDCASGFIRFYVDPNGGGWRPLQQWASSKADTKDNALIDPSTGQPWTGTFVLRWVREDGTLTDDPDDPGLALTWLPRVRGEVLTGHHVRFIPDTARDLWEADGVQIGAMVPLGVLKNLYPWLGKIPEDQLKKIIESRPTDAKELVPRGQKSTAVGDIDDNSLVFVLTRYQRQCPEYPRGAFLVAAGEDILLWPPPPGYAKPGDGEWWDRTHREPLDIPVTQFKQFSERDNPLGIALMEFLGPGNELRAFLFGAVLEHLDRFIRRKTFLPLGSNLLPEQMQAETATVLSIIPGMQPIYEDLPDLPMVVEKLFQAVKDDLNDESGLQEVAQGLNPPGVDSGAHARAIIDQVLVSLADLRQNTARGWARGARVILQLIRAFYTVAQQVSWKGNDGSYQQREFVGADLASAKDVQIQKGSFTGLTSSAKAALAESYAQLKIFDAEELRESIATNVGGTIGLQDNPHRQRVKRQIERWVKGPPKGWKPAPPQADPRTGQPVPQPDPVLAALFDQLDVDDDPGVARLRAYELGRAMASTRFSRWPAEWQTGLRAEYLRARRAAGILTFAEQQQGQQQAAAREAMPKVSIAAKAAPLDEGQTQAAMAAEGLKLPAPTGPTPEMQVAAAKVRSEDARTASQHALETASLTLEATKAGHAARQADQTETPGRAP